MKSNFTIDANFPRESADAAVLLVPKSVASEEELMDVFARGLNFPDWFGRNWDALLDTLRELSSVDKRRIIILHEDVPEKLSQKDLRIYLKILDDAVMHWRKWPDEHEITVVFPREPILKNEPPRQP
jgi:RNAse (barnase) inhibitor barstar